MGMSLSKLRKLVINREAWCAGVHGVSKSWTWLRDWTELKNEPLEFNATSLFSSELLKEVFMKEIPFELSLQIEERILTVKYGKKDILEKEMATHSNIFSRKIHGQSNLVD